MQEHIARATGPGAGVVKYDIITALSVMALHGTPALQTTVLRLIALITARYNWKQDQFCVAQTEMARLWGVSDRTVKREVRRMTNAGLIRCLRAGVRGRAGAYRLDYGQLFSQSAPVWPAVGRDFEERMAATPLAPPVKVVRVDFGRARRATPALPSGVDTWSLVLQDLAQSDPANLSNWYMKLALGEVTRERVLLTAPSRFVANFIETHLSAALSHAVRRVLGPAMRVQIIPDNSL